MAQYKSYINKILYYMGYTFYQMAIKRKKRLKTLAKQIS